MHKVKHLQQLNGFCLILLTYKRLHREVYREFQPSYAISHWFGAKGYLDHRFRAPQPILPNC